MDDSQTPRDLDAAIDGLIGFFDLGILAAYKNEPDRFVLETDYFEGHVTVTDHYAAELEESGDREGYIDVRFGYRTRQNGDLAVAAYLPDLLGYTPDDRMPRFHPRRWAGFALHNPVWAAGPDERFRLWTSRNLEGDWNVENGVRVRLEETIRTINALTSEVVGCALFKFATNPALNFPQAQNTHQYQDAHRELYGYVIDGLEKSCISRIAAHGGQTLNLSSDKTVAALRRALPAMPPSAALWPALDVISGQRRLAGHAVRPPAERVAAFEQFSQDLEACALGMEELRAHLEQALGMSGERARQRQETKQMLPRIVRPPMGHYSIAQFPQIVGKTVEQVEFGHQEGHAGVHQSEAVILHFNDGSSMGLTTGSNANNLASDHEGLRAEDFHVSFELCWVPPPTGIAAAGGAPAKNEEGTAST